MAKISVSRPSGEWRLNAKGEAHYIVNKKARCNGGGFPKGKIVQPPSDANDQKYCYNCYYHSMFDSMPKWASDVLTALMNREIKAKIHVERDQARKSYEDRDKHNAEREAAISRRSDELRKQEDEVDKLRRQQEKDKDVIELGNAVTVFMKHLAKIQVQEQFEVLRHPGRRMYW